MKDVIRKIGIAAFVAQILVAAAAPAMAVAFDPLLTFWTVLPHIFLAVAGLVVLRSGNRPATPIVSGVGLTAFTYVCIAYGPSILGGYPPEGGLEFVAYPLYMWLLALSGLAICVVAAMLGATRAYTRRSV